LAHDLGQPCAICVQQLGESRLGAIKKWNAAAALHFSISAAKKTKSSGKMGKKKGKKRAGKKGTHDSATKSADRELL
jgi:hypothetical protein